MTILLCLIVAALAVKSTAVDVAAAVKGKPLPSQQRWEQRQKAREQRRANPGYAARIWNNALESWADRSTKRHQRWMALREAREAEKGPEWVEKKLAKGRKAAQRRERFANRFGVLWGKARDAAENARERRREDEAWAANARFDAEQDPTVPAGLKGSTDLDNEGQDDATVLPFPARGEENEQQAQTDAEDGATTDQPTDGQETDTTNTEEDDSMSTPMNAPSEITSLSDAITYTKVMGDSLNRIVAQVEQWQAEIAGLAKNATAAMADTETATAYLRGAGVEGNHLAGLEQAQEHLNAIHEQFNRAAEGIGTAIESAQAGAGSFQKAHAAFTSQTGIQEQIQAAQASGNRAGKREFYEAG